MGAQPYLSGECGGSGQVRLWGLVQLLFTYRWRIEAPGCKVNQYLQSPTNFPKDWAGSLLTLACPWLWCGQSGDAMFFAVRIKVSLKVNCELLVTIVLTLR